MVTQPGGNEGFCLLDEFVCQAIPAPALAVPETAGPGIALGENAGMQVGEELALNAPGRPGDPSAPSAPAGMPVLQIVLARAFASYTEEEQARLFSALKELLTVASEVRVTRRTLDR